MNRLQIGSLLVGTAALLLVPGTAFGHAFIKQPPARNIDNPDPVARGGGKTPPCANMARTVKPPTGYTMGQQVTVQFEETVGHRGCYQVLFSPANDANWVMLGQSDDPMGRQTGTLTMNVNLPAGVTCQACTMAVLQLMTGAACPANATPDPANTYYSCADIRIGDFPDAGPTVPPQTMDGGGGGEEPDPGTSGGPSTSPTDGGGKTGESSSGNGATGNRRLSSSNNDDGGCNTSSSSSSNGGLGLAAILASVVGVSAAIRRRKTAKK